MLLFLYNIIVYIAKLSLPVFFSDIEVVGRSNVPQTGPIIIIG
jgi:1-acyl-sn-glycerol-3-phosphate acyltransferase